MYYIDSRWEYCFTAILWIIVYLICLIMSSKKVIDLNEKHKEEVSLLKAQIALALKEKEAQEKKIRELEQDKHNLENDKQNLIKEKEGLEEEKRVLENDYQTMKKMYDEVNCALFDNFDLYVDSSLKTRYEGMEDPPERFKALIDDFVQVLQFNKNLREFVFGHGGSTPKNEKFDGGSAQGDAENSPETPEGAEKPEASDGSAAMKDAVKNHKTKARKKKDLVTSVCDVNAQVQKYGTQKGGNAELLTGHTEDMGKVDDNSEPKPSPGKGPMDHRRQTRNPAKYLGGCASKASQKAYIKASFCPKCGKKHPLSVAVINALHNLLDSLVGAGLAKDNGNGSFTLVQPKEKFVCHHCGYIEPVQPMVPEILPGHGITLRSVALLANSLACGMPINGAVKTFFPDVRLGNSTAYDQIVILGDLLTPAFNAIYDYVMGAEFIHADETHFEVRNPDGTEKKTKWIIGLMTQFGNEHPAICFNGPSERGDAYKKVMASKCIGFTSDAFACYDSIEGKAHQTCLAHLARDVFKVFEAVNEETFAKIVNTIMDLDAERLDAFDYADLRNGFIALGFIYAKISLVFHYETECVKGIDCQKPDDIKLLLERRRKVRREKSRALMDDIDGIFRKLIPTRVKVQDNCENPHKKYKRLDRHDAVGEAVVYYLNHAAEFRAFLDHPELAVDTNCLEASNKAIQSTRRASLFSRSDRHAEALIKIITIIHTLKLNGVSAPGAYMCDVAAYVQRELVRRVNLAIYYEYRDKENNQDKNTDNKNTDNKNTDNKNTDGKNTDGKNTDNKNTDCKEEPKRPRPNYNRPALIKLIKLPEAYLPWNWKHEQPKMPSTYTYKDFKKDKVQILEAIAKDDKTGGKTVEAEKGQGGQGNQDGQKTPESQETGQS